MTSAHVSQEMRLASSRARIGGFVFVVLCVGGTEAFVLAARAVMQLLVNQ